MTNYWVILDNEKIGPLTVDELRNLNLTPDTPIWRAGLDDWRHAGDLEEIAFLFAPEEPRIHPQFFNVPPIPQQRPSFFGAVPGAPVQPDDDRLTKPMPSSYLVWSIICTVLCCIPFGIVAIYYSSQVSSRFDSGDYAGAEKASERAQLWIIISIVVGLISAPFTILFGML